MRRRWQIGGPRGFVVAALVATLATAAAAPAGGSGTASSVPPLPCDPAVKINDAGGDGHHAPTDVLSAWLSEAKGPLQAVIEVQRGSWLPEHDEPTVVAGYAFLFTNEGQTRFVRMSVDESGDLAFDYGTWTLAGGFVHLGDTTGERDLNPVGAAAAWIDVPAALADDGDVLTDTFVLTYDGIIGGVPTPVDQAPGGQSPSDPARGPSFVVGECAGVNLRVPASVTGGKTVPISGTVLGAGAGIDVAITRKAKMTTQVSNTQTDAEGDFSVNVPVRETTTVTAAATGLESQDRKITVRSTVTIVALRTRNGRTKIRGLTKPALPGRVQLFKTTAFTPSASKQIDGGRFSFPAKNLRPGRYEVIYTPSGGRAVRDISNRVRVR